MAVDRQAGRLAEPSTVVNVARLSTAYYSLNLIRVAASSALGLALQAIAAQLSNIKRALTGAME